MNAIRVLIADDHPFYREGVKSILLTRSDQVLVVGEAEDGLSAVRLARELRPNVVLMDLKMPTLGGIEATERIVLQNPDIAVLILTMFDDDSVVAAMRAGARGYLLKHSGVDDVVRAIEAVHRGEAILGPESAKRLAGYFARPVVSRARVFPELTERERDVLELIAKDMPTDRIARQLGVTLKTVRNYIANVLNKLQVPDRQRAAEKARAAGILDD